VSWVSADHDPALLVNPAAGAVLELAGNGMVLGVVEGMTFLEHHSPLREPDLVITM
jgi:sigma-B regulation protein RsbU (phosphoserine phosphatase)